MIWHNVTKIHARKIPMTKMMLKFFANTSGVVLRVEFNAAQTLENVGWIQLWACGLPWACMNAPIETQCWWGMKNDVAVAPCCFVLVHLCTNFCTPNFTKFHRVDSLTKLQKCKNDVFAKTTLFFTAQTLVKMHFHKTSNFHFLLVHKQWVSTIVNQCNQIDVMNLHHGQMKPQFHHFLLLHKPWISSS